MITKSDIKKLLNLLGFTQEENLFSKTYENAGVTLKVDVAAEHIISEILENQSLNVDAVSGCTIKINALVAAAEKAISDARNPKAE